MSAIIVNRQRSILHLIERSLATIFGILLVAVLLNSAIRSAFSQADRRRLHQVRVIARITLQVRLSAAQRSPLLAMANRADLATRVGAVLDTQQRRGRAGILALALACAVAVVLVISMSPVRLVAAPQDPNVQGEQLHENADLRLMAQSQQPAVDQAVPAAPAKPSPVPQIVAQQTAAPRVVAQQSVAESALAFEVASIKPHAPNSGVHEPGCSNDRFTSIGFPLDMAIRWAYELGVDASREFFGANRSLMGKSYRYDIQAKAERPVTESQCRLMVQALLADRFKLAVHWESKDAQVSDLVVAPGGPKMQKARETDVGTDLNIVTNGRPLSTAPRDPAAEPDPKGFTMKELADLLTSRREKFEPIVDKTGLEGRYKIDLRYSTGLSDAARSFAARLGTPSDADQAVDPELEPALQKQLGLRLEKHKGSIKILILDHIEPPDAN